MRQFHDGKVKNHPFEQITVRPELRVGTCFLGVFQGDVESVGTLSPAGSFHGSYATEPCPMAAQVVVKSTFLDVEEPSLLERFRRLRRAVTEPELESGMERYEPGKFSWGTHG